MLIGLTTYVLSGLLLLSHFRYQLNPDAISYISIAQHYLDGHWNAAINAYWSPLYSWLLIPFIALGIDNLVAAKVLNFALGGGVLIGAWQLGYVINLTPLSRRFLIAILISIVLQWSCSFVTPDVLTVALLIFYLNILLRPDFARRPLLGVWAGVVGALAFLSKAYALPFVLVSFGLLWAWQSFAFSQTKKRTFTHVFFFGFSFAAIVVPWVALVSNKYHRLTLGTAGAYNFSVIGPKYPGHPMWTMGMLDPPNRYALSAWEDPTFLPLKNWNPFSSFAYFQFWLHKIVSNWADAVAILNEFSYLGIPCLVAAATLAISKMRRNTTHYDPILGLLLSSLLFMSGYTLVFLEQRYVWLFTIVSLICGFYLIERLLDARCIAKAAAFTLIGLIAVSFITPSIFWLNDNLDVDRRYYEASIALPVMRGSRFASNDMRGLYFAYYKQATFYGIPRGSQERIAQDLRRRRIDYYFLFGVEAEPRFLHGLDRVSSGDVSNLRIYKINCTRL